MCCRFIILFVYVVCSYGFYSSANRVSKQLKHAIKKDVHSEIAEALEDLHAEMEDNFYNNNNATVLFTKWSPWSRCVDCFQRRMKKCISDQCEDSTIYEEKPCGKKRCKRKARQKKQFHVLHLYEDNSQMVRQAPSRVWSRWSSWSPCSDSCRTHRIRYCRRPERCKKRHQDQNAYCYHDNSLCENYVLHLLDNQNNRYDKEKFQYSNNDLARRVSRKRKSSKKCGVQFRKTRMLKIIGGVESKKYKWPWHVAILNKYHEVFCGGTLIGSRWVLTASHCIRPYLRVRLNEHDLAARDGREIEMTVYRMFQHPKFNHKTVDNDIALLQLPKSVNIPIACLPNKNSRPGEMCSVMGWGKIRASDTYGTNILHEAKLPVVQPEVCKRSYKNFLITANMFCAGWPSGKADTCAGDSGGGLMCPLKHKPSSKPVYAVQGITSFGDGCGLKNKYGIYTTVFNYLKWIYYVMDHYS